MNRYPTLALIDGLRAHGTAFATARNADDLERAARRLTAAYWSEATFLTGAVSAAAYSAVVDRLDSMA